MARESPGCPPDKRVGSPSAREGEFGYGGNLSGAEATKRLSGGLAVGPRGGTSLGWALGETQRGQAGGLAVGRGRVFKNSGVLGSVGATGAPSK